MRKMFVFVFLLQHFGRILSSINDVRVIENVSLLMLNTTSTRINGTCDECLCAMLSNVSSFSSLNCFRNNNTCEMFSMSLNVISFTLINNWPSSFYFIPLSTNDTTSTTAPIVQSSINSTNETNIQIPVVYGEYLWTFDSTFEDFSSTFNGTPINGASFSSTSITGYGSSLSLSSTLNQSVLFNSPFLNLSGHSWTFEAWISLSTVFVSAENSIVGQCQSPTLDHCLYLVIRNGIMHMGFYSDGLDGVTTLSPSTWYHVTYAFNSTSRNQSVYLNGVIENSRTANNSYLANSGSLMVGTSSVHLGNNSFNGFIDQLYFINRTKTASEILHDATLTLDFSFDGGSIYDGGPLKINGSRVGATNVVTGRVNQALELGPSNNSYFTVSGLVLLGTSNQSYSMSIWIQPSSWSGTIIHVSSLSTGTGWCLGMLGLSSSGQLITTSWQGGLVSVTGPIVPLNTWTHAVATYSTTNGLRLYVNGTFWGSTVPFGYIASGSADYLFVGNPLSGTSCSGAPIAIGQYSGAVDEFRLYSRELTASNVVTLANP